VSATEAERRHMRRVAEMGCVLCRLQGRGATPAQVHHIRDGQGMAQRASDWLCVPLCPDCHTGPRGLHGDKSLLRVSKVDELDLLALTIKELLTA